MSEPWVVDTNVGVVANDRLDDRPLLWEIKANSDRKHGPDVTLPQEPPI